MKKVAAVVCNSGLGHLKRVLYVLKLFQATYPGYLQADIYVDNDKLKHFAGLIDGWKKQKFPIRFFDVKADLLEYENEFFTKHQRAFHEADFIWSDNLLFPLKYRNDVFLTGSFLWSEVYSKSSVLKAEEELFMKKKPWLFNRCQ